MRLHRKRGVWLAWLCASALLTLDATSEEPKLRPSIRTEMLVVQFPQEIGLRLRPLLRNEQTVTNAVDQIHALIAEGKATLVGAPVLWTVSCQRAVFESYDEIRSVTEPYPVAPPGGFTAPPEPTLQDLIRRFHLGFDIPVAFETRNAGITLELEPIVEPDGRTLSIALVPQHVTYLGDRATVRRRVSLSGRVYSQPIFRTFRTTTSTTLTSGQWTLVTLSIIAGSPNSWEVCLLRSTILPE